MSKDLKITVTGVVVTSLQPKIKNKVLEHLIPKVLIPQRLEFILGGVSNAISNAIRRTVLCELPVRALHCEYEDIKTNDAHVIPDMIQTRLKMIPIDQTTPLDATFDLDMSNKGLEVADIKTGYFKGKKPPCNPTHTLLSLNPGKFIKISNIRVFTEYGHRVGHGMMVLAVNAVSLAVDVIPLNTYEGTGVPSRVADPRVWKIAFNTNGTMDPIEIVKMACNGIVSRMQSVQDLLSTIENSEDQYILNVHGESHTIGNLLMKTICELFPDITAVTYNVSSVERMFTLRVRCDEDINTVLNVTVRHLIKVFNDIHALM